MRRVVSCEENLIPCVEPWEMAMIDRFMVDTYHISLIQMMENAGVAPSGIGR